MLWTVVCWSSFVHTTTLATTAPGDVLTSTSDMGLVRILSSSSSSATFLPPFVEAIVTDLTWLVIKQLWPTWFGKYSDWHFLLAEATTQKPEEKPNTNIHCFAMTGFYLLMKNVFFFIHPWAKGCHWTFTALINESVQFPPVHSFQSFDSLRKHILTLRLLPSQSLYFILQFQVFPVEVLKKQHNSKQSTVWRCKLQFYWSSIQVTLFTGTKT